MTSPSLRVFNIQNYSVHDGPGIRTIVFLKGCPLACQWCCNPESQSGEFMLRHIKFRCIACGNCIKSCHKSAAKELVTGLIKFDYKLCNVCKERYCLETCYNDALLFTGKDYSIEALYEIVNKDSEFYVNSGGGVTFSGGEPFAQGESLLMMLKLCKENGISTAIETCGYANSELIKRAVKYTDYFLFDLKIVDSQKHKLYTKRDNKLIMNNLKILSDLGADITARIPLIPEVTDNNENIDAIIDICLTLKIKKSTLGIYHTLGVGKYEEYGLEYNFDTISQQDNTYYLNIQDKFNSHGIECEIL